VIAPGPRTGAHGALAGPKIPRRGRFLAHPRGFPSRNRPMAGIDNGGLSGRMRRAGRAGFCWFVKGPVGIRGGAPGERCGNAARYQPRLKGRSLQAHQSTGRGRQGNLTFRRYHHPQGEGHGTGRDGATAQRKARRLGTIPVLLIEGPRSGVRPKEIVFRARPIPWQAGPSANRKAVRLPSIAGRDPR